MQEYDPVTLEILWERLMTIVDEGAVSLRNTAFSLLIREGNDFAIVLLDPEGNAVAQNRACLPNFAGTIPPTVRYVVQKFRNSWRPGDVVIMNDPWLSAGHVNDLSIVTPIFGEEGVAAFAANSAHAADIGGLRIGSRSKDMYEEGLRIPPFKLYAAGEPNKVLFEMIRDNVRLPDQVIGDIESQVSANETAGRKLKQLLAEFGINNLSSLTAAILSRSESIMRDAIREVPDGAWSHEVKLDGIDAPLTIRATVEVKGTNIHIDYSGTSPQVAYPLNCVPNYTYAYTAYPVRTALCRALPNNDGLLKPITVSAPLGSLLNPRPPAPVSQRARTGHFCAGAVYGALAQIIPEKVIADSGSTPSGTLVIAGEREDGSPFGEIVFVAGGMGARSNMDGLSCVQFPANVSASPVEILESSLPILYEEKEFIPDSAGQGEYRGGFGARHRFKIVSSKPVWIAPGVDRTKFPAEGVLGGKPGSLLRLSVQPPKNIPPKDYTLLQPGDVLTIDLPGGGGYGNPGKRSPELMQKDIDMGLVSVTKLQ
ncbi:MAG TPA: hydantoinase B/oxoprolinase family protein [Syntrophorhabdales bacterium]|nr:hydantoinase B/oxoprolinase family protein [Syntrophorhabdales bacterium]